MAAEAELLRIHLQGFIDVGMLKDRLDGVFPRLQHEPPVVVLCDLRTVSGYGPGTSTLAREWLLVAQRTNVCRVAMMVGSSVIRTAVKVLAAESQVPLRCFLGEREALRWLGEREALLWLEKQRASNPSRGSAPEFKSELAEAAPTGADWVG